MKSVQIGRVALTALGLSFAPWTASADTVWGPMWDVRSLPMEWQVKASDPTLNVHAYFADGGRIRVYDGAIQMSVISGTGDRATGALSVTPGNVYRMVIDQGFHVRPNWDGVEWIRLGPGRQAAGPAGGVGFQSDAELGFDSRWNNLPSRFADTTWSFNVAAGETLRLSLEHMTGNLLGAKRFEFISPSGLTYIADADGMPGSGNAHFAARGGSLNNAPNPASVYWEEYTAPTSEAGWWGFKLISQEGTANPYAWHYVLDRTDAGADQFAYLRPGALAPPVPEPSALVLLMSATSAGIGTVLSCRKNRARRKNTGASQRSICD